MTMDRRTVLRGAGTAVALPFLEAMLPRRASAATKMKRPLRFIVFGEMNGHIRSTWVPTGTETAFQFSETLKPVEPFRDRLVIIDGLDKEASTKSEGPPHMKALGPMLTGSSLQKGNFTPGGVKASVGMGYPGNISVDQKIAQAVGDKTKFRSLELGVQVDAEGNPETRMCYRAINQPLPPENDPRAAYDRLFADLPPPGVAKKAWVAEHARRRRSVLDLVMDDYRRMLGTLGAEDKQRLESHLSSLREIEGRLEIGAGASCQRPRPVDVRGIACTEPDQAARRNDCTDDVFGAIGRAQMDVMTTALACDLTRVATLQWSNCGNRVVFSSLGHNKTHHDLEHQADAKILTQINVWYAQQFAYLMTKLASVKELDGSTLLDNCVVLWCYELSNGAKHGTTQMPYVLAGRAGGRLRSGRFLTFQGRAHNDLLISCMNLMGVEGETFGDAKYCKGPLPLA